MLIRQLFILVIGFLSVYSSHANDLDYRGALPIISLPEEGKGAVQVGNKMLYSIDKEHHFNISKVLENPPDWRLIEKPAPNFGFTADAYWFTFILDNQSSAPREVLVELPIPFLDDVKMYRLDGDTIAESHAVGDRLPFSQRPMEHQNLLMPFTLDPGHNHMIMRVAAAGTVEAPLFIWDPEQFLFATAHDRLLQGIWFGILIIMVVYNLFLFAQLKDLSYLYYVGFVMSYLMFQTSLKGYGFAYLWPNMLEWNSYAIAVFVALSNFFAALMVINFLELKERSIIAYRLMSLNAIVAGTSFLLCFILPYSFNIRFSSTITAFTCIFALSSGYWNWYRGYSDAKFFCLAWTSAFGGVGFLVAAKFGALPANIWTNNAGQIGVMLLVALLSFALANRYNREKELRIKAQARSLEHEQMARQSQSDLLKARIDANIKLERKVKERTETLEQAMTELEHANKKLEILSTTDALTQLHNRGHFENALQMEFKRAIRHQRPLSIILSDVDHFKHVNDTYGHKAGDACLKAIARVFKERVSRPGDLVARYGGEEFIILLADTELEQAKALAYSLCKGIRELSFAYSGKAIPVSASFGVSTLNTVGVVSADQLVTQADLSLYQAKNNGRDQVIAWDTERNEPEPTTDYGQRAAE